MKRLWACLGILVSTVAVVGVFLTPQKVAAQSLPDKGNYDYFQNQATPLFTTAEASLSATKTAINATVNDPDKATKVVALDKFIAEVAAMRSVYNDSFNSQKSTSVEPAKAQVTAINLTLQHYRDFLTSLTAPERFAQALSIMNVFKGTPSGLEGLLEQANKIDRGVYIAGSDEANLLGNATAVQQTGTSNAGLASKNDKLGCSFINPMNLGACISEAVTWLIKNTLLEIAGFLTWAAVNMFNYSVKLGILNFALWAPDTLYPIWMIIRQIISLLIVFVGLYLGFLYILGRDPEKFEKYIPWVVIFALFVNFSYPLVRTAVDISNIVSLKIYTATVGTDSLAKEGPSAGSLIMSRLGLQGLVASAVNTAETPLSMVKSVSTVPGALMVVVYVLYAGYIFFMATGIMLMRTISLVFLIIASPILLIDSVIPMLGDKAKELRKILFEQLAVGPVFMIMLALTVKFLDVFSVAMGKSADLLSDTTITQLFNILLMLIMLHMMLKVTKSISGEIGTYGTNFMGKVGGFGLGVATGGAGFLARGTIGKAAMGLRDSKWVERNQDTFIGRRAYDLTNSVAKSSFDLRNSTVVAGKMTKAGMGLGMGKKTGYEQSVEEKRKDTLERSTRIKTRYERDTYAKDGTLLARKGDIDEKSQAAMNRYVNTAGGALLGGTRFMTKEDKKTREALGAKADEEMKKIIDDNKAKSAQDVARYKAINKEYMRENIMSGTPEEAKEDFVNQLEKELRDLKGTDPNLMGAQAQSLLQTIKTIKEERRSEQAAFEKQIDVVLSTYNRKKAIDEKDANNYLTNQSEEINAAVQAKLNGTYVSTDVNNGVDFELPDAPLTGKDLRRERIERVLERRGRDVEEKEEQLKVIQSIIGSSNQSIQAINKKYDDELKSLEKDSSILDSNGRPVKIAPSAEEVAAVEKRRQDDLKEDVRILSDARSAEKQYINAESKQESSQAKAAQFSLNLNTASASERFAAKRKAKLAQASAQAQQGLAASVASPSTAPPSAPVPPTSPSSPAAARPVNAPPANDPRVAQAA